MTYQLLNDLVTGKTSTTMVMRLPDRAHIPADPSNVDWQAYRAWLADGNVPSAIETSKPATVEPGGSPSTRETSEGPSAPERPFIDSVPVSHRAEEPRG